MANHLQAELVLDALEMAVGQRRPQDVIHHSDQGHPANNAMCECFFATLECEVLDRRRFASQAEARVACSASSKAFTTWRGCSPPENIVHLSDTRRNANRAAISQGLNPSTNGRTSGGRCVGRARPMPLTSASLAASARRCGPLAPERRIDAQATQ